MIINLINFTHAALAFMIAFSAFFTAPVVLEKKVAQFETAVDKTQQKLKKPIFNFGTEERKVALTFNAAFGAGDTDGLLNVLRENDVLATFFFCERWVDKFPGELLKFAEAGHDIANHGNTHEHVARYEINQNFADIRHCGDKIRDVTGIETYLYRPAYGEYDDDVISAAEAFNHITVLWDVDSGDWLGRGVTAESVSENENLCGGSIILFHNDANHTAEHLDAVIKGLREKGYKIVPVSHFLMTE